MSDLDEAVIQETIDKMMALTPTERLRVMSEFCLSCGGDDPGCPCWNDE